MPHVTFGEEYPARRSSDDSHALVVSSKKKEDDDNTKVLRRSRSISYRFPETQPNQLCNPAKPIDAKICIERKFVYKDSKGTITKITYEDSYGQVIKRIYPTQPPAPQKECRSTFPPACEPSKNSSEDKRNFDLTKIVVRNGRGVVWKVMYLNCDGKTMKTEYPEPDASRGRSTETRRYVIKEVDAIASRRRYSETKKIEIDKEYREPAPRCSTDVVKKEIKSAMKTVAIDKESREPAPKSSDDTATTEKKSQSLYTVKRRKDSGRSEEYFDFLPKQEKQESVTDTSSKQSSESDREVYKDENGVTKKVVYTDSRGRRRTVVYDD